MPVVILKIFGLLDRYLNHCRKNDMDKLRFTIQCHFKVFIIDKLIQFSIYLLLPRNELS